MNVNDQRGDVQPPDFRTNMQQVQRTMSNARMNNDPDDVAFSAVAICPLLLCLGVLFGLVWMQLPGGSSGGHMSGSGTVTTGTGGSIHIHTCEHSLQTYVDLQIAIFVVLGILAAYRVTILPRCGPEVARKHLPTAMVGVSFICAIVWVCGLNMVSASTYGNCGPQYLAALWLAVIMPILCCSCSCMMAGMVVRGIYDSDKRMVEETNELEGMAQLTGMRYFLQKGTSIMGGHSVRENQNNTQRSWNP
jgi:hypothetical protein